MAIQWNNVKADFNDTNSAMNNAQQGLSQAGTVFGELRKAILEEEQKAIENNYRQKIFDENIRQFGLQYELDQDKLAEQSRASLADEAYKNAALEAQIKSDEANRALRAQEIANQRAYNMGRLGLDQQRFKHEIDLYNKEMAARQAGINAVTQAEEINKQVTSLNTQIKDVDDKIKLVSTMPDLLFKFTYGKDVTKDSVIKQLTDQKTDLNKQLSSFGGQALLATTASGKAKILEDAYFKSGGDGSFKGSNWLNIQSGYEREDAKTKKASIAEIAKQNKEFDNNITKKLKDTYGDLNTNDLASAMSIYNDLRENKGFSGPEAFNMIVSNIKEKGRLDKVAAWILNNSNYTYDDLNDVIQMLNREESFNNSNNLTNYEYDALNMLFNPFYGLKQLGIFK